MGGSESVKILWTLLSGEIQVHWAYVVQTIELSKTSLRLLRLTPSLSRCFLIVSDFITR